MSKLKQCEFMPKMIKSGDQLYLTCDEEFIKGTIERKGYNCLQVDGVNYYPLTHLASVGWFSDPQLNAFGDWLKDVGETNIEGAIEIEWIGPKDKPALMIGFAKDGDVFVIAHILKIPKFDDDEHEVKSLTMNGMRFVCLQDIAKIDDDPTFENMMVYTLTNSLARKKERKINKIRHA